MTTELLQMIWSLALVIGIILLFYAFFRKKFSLTAHQQDKEIKIIEMRPLPGKKSLCLVEVGGKKLLLGVAENAISSLAEFPEETSFATALRNCRQQQTEQKTEQQREQQYS